MAASAGLQVLEYGCDVGSPPARPDKGGNPHRFDWHDLLDRLWLRVQSLFVPAVAVASVLQARTAKEPQQVVLQLFSWERDRLMTLAKGTAGAAVTVLTGLIAAAIEGSVTVPPMIVFLAALLVAELLVWAGFIVTGLHRLAQQYPVSLEMID